MTNASHFTVTRLLAAIVVACFCGLVQSPAAAAGELPEARTFVSYEGVDGALLTGSGSARVVISTAGAAAGLERAAASSARLRRALAAQPTHAELAALAASSSVERGVIAASVEARRHRALERLQPAVDAAVAAQAPLVHAIEETGGQVIERNAPAGTVTAIVARRHLRALSRRADVAAITAAPDEKPLNMLSESSAIMGAPAFWTAGFLGGRGANDKTGPDLALIADRIYQHHPAFSGVTFQNAAWASALCSPSIVECAHGTQVAGVAFSGGVDNGTSDKDQKGIAPGVDTVLDADLDYWADAPWILGWDQSDSSVAPQPGAADPAEIINASYGSSEAVDDTPGARAYDFFATGFGLTSAIAAGNEGPTPRTVASPCFAYDSICVGAVRLAVGETANDMTIPDWSSRGPSPGGRKKPDLVAIGTVGSANPNWTNDGKLWGGVTGTSFAAPQVAGAATLLAGSGVTHHLAHKSVLINSARQGRKVPTDPMGTQTDWQPDWGWGALDLAAALEQRSAVVPSTTATAGTAGNHAVAGIAPGDVHFYSAATQAAGDRATLVWDRRAVACLSDGCPEGSEALTLSNLNLYETSATGGARTASESTIDNVEQVRSADAASVIYKVKAASAIDGATTEPYSLAARRPLTRLATPRPKVTVTFSSAQTKPGQDVTVTATIANPSPDLAAGDVTATLELPAGAELVSGSAARAIGTLSTSSSSTQTWTVRFANDGSQAVRVAVAASALAESLPASVSRSVLVDGTPPSQSSPSAPSGSRTDTNVPVSWGASDSGSGVASYDVEVAVNGGPFTAWLTQTTSTSATYPGQVGSSYQFRTRARDQLGNVSAWSTGPVVAITAPAAPSPPPATSPTPAPTATPRAATSLKITAAKLTRTALRVTGRRSTRATGSVAVQFTAKVRGRTLKARKTTTVTRGRFAATLKLPARMRGVRAGTVTVRYAGDSRHLPNTVRRAARRS